MDDTIAPSLYRTGRGDRAIPLGLGVFTLLAGVALGAATGPFFFPWGLAVVGAGVGVSAVSFRRFWRARQLVTWDEASTTLVTQVGRNRTSVDVATLTRVEVNPAGVQTRLFAPGKVVVLSHRLVRVETLLDRIRVLRPDLFPVPNPFVLRTSGVGLASLVVLAAGTGLVAGVLATWWSPVGVFFAAAAAGVLLRALWSVPRKFVVEPGRLTVAYVVRRRVWTGPTAFREEAYPAAGAVFFRMRIEFGPRTVVLDEGDLVDPLRPWAGLIVRWLDSSAHR